MCRGGHVEIKVFFQEPLERGGGNVTLVLVDFVQVIDAVIIKEGVQRGDVRLHQRGRLGVAHGEILQEDQWIVSDNADVVMAHLHELLFAVLIQPYRRTATIAGGGGNLEDTIIDFRLGRGPMGGVFERCAAECDMACAEVVLEIGRIDVEGVILWLAIRADVEPALVLDPVEGLDQFRGKGGPIGGEFHEVLSEDFHLAMTSMNSNVRTSTRLRSEIRSSGMTTRASRECCM